MGKFSNRISFVVATRNRPEELKRMLRSLEVQSYLPDEVILVDGSDREVSLDLGEITRIKIKYLRCYPPSGTKQRNRGIISVDSNTTLIGFLDDDAVLEPGSVIAMMDFWEKASGRIGGAGFNLVNHPPFFAREFKFLPLTEKLGLYSRRPGVVLSSGFHSMIGHLDKNEAVQWLPAVSVWRKVIFDEFMFDEWFGGYSYLEDLDFSYRVGKKYQLVVVSDARYHHYPAVSGRDSGYVFGRRELRNRLYFVDKHTELSRKKCYLGFSLRMFISIISGFRGKGSYFFSRVWGNLVETFHQLTKCRD